MTDPLDPLFAALADPTRRAVLEQLAEGAQSVSALAAPYRMALPSFLRHIEVLEGAGLVVTRKQGRSRLVALKPGSLRLIDDWLASQRQLWSGRLTRLEVIARRFETQRGTIPDNFTSD